MTCFTKTETGALAAQFIDFFTAARVDYLNLAALIPAASGEGMVMERGKRARDRAEIERLLSWATVRNREGENIYTRPAQFMPDGSLAGWPIIFLDDLSPTTAAGIARKYRSIVVETSADNCQVWIALCRPCSEHERRLVQSALAPLVGADPGSVSGEHFGRMPGYCNRKSGRNNHRIVIWGTNGDGPALDPAPCLIGAPGAVSTPFLPSSGAVCHRFTPAATQDPADDSALDFRYALVRLHADRPAEEIVEAVFRHAMNRGKHAGSEPCVRQYAEATVRKASVVRTAALGRA